MSPGSDLEWADRNSAVTLVGNTSSNDAEVNTDKELLVHDQHVIDAIKESTAPAENGYKFFVSSGEISAGLSTSDNPILLLRNPAGSGKTVKFDVFDFAPIAQSTRTIFRVWGEPTITNVGTNITANISNYFIGSANAKVALAYTSPTISSNGKLKAVHIAEVNEVSFFIHMSLILPAGKDVLLTAKPPANNKAVVVSATWVEVTP